MNVRRRVLTAVALGCALTASAVARAGVTPWVDLEVRDGHVLFAVEVAGHEGRAIFDTGAQDNTVSTELVERAGLKLNGKRFEIVGVVSSDERVGSVGTLPVKLFGIDFKLRNVPALPLHHELIIGAGFLKAGVLQLDYPNRRMRLITPDSVDLSKAANVPLRLQEGTNLPAIQVTIDGSQRWMMLDTGNAGPILMRRMVASQAGWIERFKRAESAIVDVNAAVSAMDMLVLPSVRIGPFELEDVPVQIPAPGEEIRITGASNSQGRETRVRQGVRISGIVGYEVLRHFVVTLDYDRQLLHIAPPPEPPAAAPAANDTGREPGER